MILPILAVGVGEGLLQGLGFHNVCVGRAVVKGVDPLLDPFLVAIDQHIQPILFRHMVPELDHLLELPGGVDMHKRERRLLRIKGLEGQVQQHGAVLADGVQHDRLLTFGGHLPDNVDGLRLQLFQMGQFSHGVIPPSFNIYWRFAGLR